MSKSIRELMVEAGMQFKLDSASAKIENGVAVFEELYVYDKFDPVKYAVLTAKECARICVKEARQLGGRVCSDKIKQHFGVEE